MRLLGLLLIASNAAAQAAKPIEVVISTTLGDITVALDSAHAPITVTNFLKYVDGGFYTEGRFHRTVTMDNQPRDSVRIQVIQGGINSARSREAFPAIPIETTDKTGIKHVDGAISMARGAPNSARSDFFICIGAQPSLDFAGHRNLDGQGFAAFGVVTKGMDVVRKIQGSPANGQNLTPPVQIISAKRSPR